MDDFITWHQLHAALAKKSETNVRETIKATYNINNEALKSIESKHEAKIKELKNKIAGFKQAKLHKHEKFDKFVDKIYNDINNFKQKSRVHLQREAADRGRAKAILNGESDDKEAVAKKLRDIFGDEDFDYDLVDQMGTTVKDLLALEFNNNKYLNQFKGCRKSKYISGATTARTKCLNGLLMQLE